jgi:hypothetical protein
VEEVKILPVLGDVQELFDVEIFWVFKPTALF